ncbi:MAG: MFS transporter [Alphaproteobacteria bacterium]
MRQLIKFSLFDAGNSVFPMLVLSALTSSYFVNHIVADEQLGTALWQLTIGIAGIFIALVMPYIGNVADNMINGRLKLLRLFTFLCILFVGCFYFILPNQEYVLTALVILFLGSVTYEASNSLYNSIMKNCSTSNLTLSSGIGFGTGFLGGVLILVLLLYTLILPQPNLFGISMDNYLHLRFAHIILAFWFLVFCLPLLYFSQLTQETAISKNKISQKIKNLIWDKGLTNVGKYLIARMLYMDGLIIVSTSVGIFGTSVMGLSISQILMVAIIANISGAIGCYLFGARARNDKNTIITTLLILSFIVILISMNKNPNAYIVLVVAGTFFAGPLQSSSRVVMANLIPNETQGLGFGLFTFSGKATAFIGPVCAAALTFLISQRAGFAFSIVLLILGAFLMLKVSYEKN